MIHPAWFISRDGVCEARASDGLFLCHCVLLKAVRLTWFCSLAFSNSAHKKGERRTEATIHTPAKAHSRTTQGRRPHVRERSSECCFDCSRAFRLRLAVCGEAELDVHTSIKLSGWPISGHKSLVDSPLEIRLAFWHSVDAVSIV